MKEKLEELKAKLAESSILLNELSKNGVVITVNVDNGLQSKSSIIKAHSISSINIISATMQTEL